MTETQPDWSALAEKFDLWVPQMAPITEVMLDELTLSAGARVLDIACGTGEPALSVAKRFPEAMVTATDAAAPMTRVAAAKAAEARLSNIEFLTMPAEDLALPDDSFDAVTCRFGLMLFDDPAAAAREMARVLRPDGQLVLVVWGPSDTMKLMLWADRAFRDHVPDDMRPPVKRIGSMGEPGALQGVLKDAGFDRFSIVGREIEYVFPSREAYWAQLVDSQILKAQFDALGDTPQAAVRDSIYAQAAPHCDKDGTLRIPLQYLLASHR